MFDREGDGKINVMELRHIMVNLGEKLSEEEVEEMINIGDMERLGYIKYEELVDIMLGLKTVEEKKPV